MARKNAKPAHGGKRPGAGRPALAEGEAAVNGTLRLYPSTWALLDALCAATGKTRREAFTACLVAYVEQLPTLYCNESRSLRQALGEIRERPLADPKNNE